MAQPALNLTDEQHAAIFAQGVSVALSAGAGCGKTFVLTERFLSYLAPPSAASGRTTSLSQMVAITFTDRAAREMRDRIRKKCHERLMVDDANVDHWLSLLRQLEAARVSTIHSFCGSLLRSHPIEAGLDPRFGVLDPNQASTLLNDLLDDELRRQLADQNPPLIDLVVDYGLRTLRSMVQILLAERQAIDFDACQNRSPDELVSAWHQFQEAQVWPAVLRRVCRSPAARTLLRVLRSSLPSNATMRARCQALDTLLPELERTPNPAGALDEIREQAKVQGGGGAKAWPSEEAYNTFRDAATKLRADVDKAREALNFDAVKARLAAISGLQLLAVTRPVIEAYQRRKQELGMLDFDDLLIRAHDLLTAAPHSELRKRVAAGIELLLVDEFQDTDPLQVSLVKSLCGERLTRGKLFFVGDYKQSIYRFRGADPRVFRQLREEMPDRGRLPLSRNFRSQPAILHFVNALFESELGPEYEPLVPDRIQVGPEPAIEFLWSVGEEDEDAEVTGRVSRLREREADWIARRLRSIVDSGETLVYEKAAGPNAAPTARAVKPGDIAILFRALSDVQYYENALRRYGLEYYVVGGHAFYAQQEVFDILNLLRTIASPADAVSLAGVLRSPIFSLDDETLFWLAQHQQGLTAGLFAQTLSPELSAAQQARVRFAAVTLADLRAMRDRVPIAELVQQTLARTGYDATLLAEFLGQRKLANLKKLIDQARSMDRAGIFTLADFISQLSDFVVRQPDEALAATQAETANVVRLMSIHQSKGLEFPVVVVPDLERKSRGSTTPAAFHPDLGPLVRHPEGTGLSGLELLRLAEEPESAAEQSRLLYVATTRAADYLILSSGIADLASPRGAWTQLLAERFDLTTGQLLATLPAGYGFSRVRVTTTEPELAGKPSGESRRPDLDELVERARTAAASHLGAIPTSVAAISPDRLARRGFSFSRLSGQLKRLAMPDEAEAVAEGDVVRPAQLDSKGLGTLVHEILASWNLATENDVAQIVERHAGRHLADDAAEERAEAIELIGRFVKSARADELRRARQLHREIEFLVAWPPERPEPGGQYLHGVIDCLSEDEFGNWHLLDYKTDRASEANLAGVAAHYEMQMLIYALAAERILGVAPASLTLHFLRSGMDYAFDWNDAARLRAAQLVERAMAEAAGSRR